MTTFVAAVRGPTIGSADNVVTVWPVGEVLEAVLAAPNTMRKAEEDHGIVFDRTGIGSAVNAWRSYRDDRLGLDTPGGL